MKCRGLVLGALLAVLVLGGSPADAARPPAGKCVSVVTAKSFERRPAPGGHVEYRSVTSYLRLCLPARLEVVTVRGPWRPPLR